MIVDALDIITAEDCLLDTVDPIKTGREISIWIFMRYDIGPDYNDTDKTRLGINWVEHVFKTYFRKKLSWQYLHRHKTLKTQGYHSNSFRQVCQYLGSPYSLSFAFANRRH